MTGRLPQRLAGCEVLPPLIRDDIEPTHNAERRNGPASSERRSKSKEPSENRKASADRFAVLNTFVDCSMPKLSRAEALTWIVLFRDTRNGTARTSAADIARRIGVTRRAVTDALAGLRKRQLIKVVYQGGMNRGISVHQVCPLATPKAVTREDEHDDDSLHSQ